MEFLALDKKLEMLNKNEAQTEWEFVNKRFGINIKIVGRRRSEKEVERQPVAVVLGTSEKTEGIRWIKAQAVEQRTDAVAIASESDRLLIVTESFGKAITVAAGFFEIF